MPVGGRPAGWVSLVNYVSAWHAFYRVFERNVFVFLQSENAGRGQGGGSIDEKITSLPQLRGCLCRSIKIRPLSCVEGVL